MGRKLTTKEFIEKAKKIHGDKYDYSKVEYKNNYTEIKIICNVHNEFKQKPVLHLTGRGCLECGLKRASEKRTLTTEEFVKKARKIHKDRYDYSKVEYINSKTKVDIVCRIHGIFSQAPHKHLGNRGCFKCASEKKVLTKEEFIKKAKKIHKDRYCYNEVNYIGCRNKVIIICAIHGRFRQLPYVHLQGRGCQHCRKKNEGKVKNLLFKYFKGWKIIPNKKIWDKYKDYNHKRYCDFWLEKNGIKTMIEYDGIQHFEPVTFGGRSLKQSKKIFKQTQLKDKLDTEFCKENQIILHRIKYSEDKEKSIIKFKEKLIKKYGIK